VHPTLERAFKLIASQLHKHTDKTFLKKVFGHAVIRSITKAYPEHFPGIQIVQALLSMHFTIEAILQELLFIHQ
jgi:hypothetical protein